MYEDFLITDIFRIIYVSATEYPSPRTQFESDLSRFELIYKISGETKLHFHDTVTPIKAGTVYILPKGHHSQYWVESIQHGDCIDIFFDAKLPFTHEIMKWDMRDNRLIESLFKKTFSVWSAQNNGYFMECMSLLYSIFSKLQEKQYVSRKQYALIKPAVEYIHDNFYITNICCEELAKRCGISHAYLNQLFLRQFKLSPQKYALQLRMNYACSLLKEGYSVRDTAAQAGFSDIYYFSKAFKKHTGMTPTEHVKKYLSSK